MSFIHICTYICTYVSVKVLISRELMESNVQTQIRHSIEQPIKIKLSFHSNSYTLTIINMQKQSSNKHSQTQKKKSPKLVFYQEKQKCWLYQEVIFWIKLQTFVTVLVSMPRLQFFNLSTQRMLAQLSVLSDTIRLLSAEAVW